MSKKVEDKMDIVQLTTLLSSCLPLLLKFGDKVAESAGGEVGKNVLAIWSKLYPKLAAKEGTKVAAEQLAAKPDSQARKAVFQEELEILLKENPDIAEVIAKILQEETISGQVNIAVKGDNSGVIGNNIKDSKVVGSVDIQGDLNM